MCKHNCHKVVICLGGNAVATESEIELATEFIADLGEITARTGSYPTQPEYAGEKYPYLNRIVILHTPIPLQHLESRTKNYEGARRGLNRESDHVNIDIDIVVFDNRILRRADASSAYFRQGLSILQEQGITV